MDGGSNIKDEQIKAFMSEFSKGTDIVNETLRKYKIDPRKVIILPYEDHLTFLVDEALFDNK